MSDEDRPASSKADRVESWAKFIGVAGGLIAVFTGIQQFWSANVHDQRELRWNQANTALEMVNSMVADVSEHTNANYFLHTCDVTFDVAKGTMEVHESTTEPWRVTLVDTGEETQHTRHADFDVKSIGAGVNR